MSSKFRDLVSEPLRALSAYEVPRPAGVRAKLDANESPFSLPPEVADELARELAAVALHRYPDAGCGELRELLASEWGVPPAALTFGNGSDELIALLISAFRQPREGAARARVLYPVPSFVVYRLATLAAGAEPVEVPLRAADFQLDEPAMLAALAGRRPNLVFFARPNNPTGSLWSRAFIERVLREHPDVLVVVDEAYIAYGGDSFIDRFAAYDNLILMHTLSKIGMAALRVGYLIAHPDVAREVEKVRPPYNIGGLNQRAAAWLLTHHRARLEAQCEQIKAERERLRRGMLAIGGLELYDSEANLILFRVPGSHGVWQALAQRGVLVRKFGGGGVLEECLRVTVGTPEDDDLFLATLREILA